MMTVAVEHQSFTMCNEVIFTGACSLLDFNSQNNRKGLQLGSVLKLISTFCYHVHCIKSLELSTQKVMASAKHNTIDI